MRIVSVWLPRWPILRFLAAQTRQPSPTPIDPDLPFVLSVEASGGARISALNQAAEAEGLAIGDSLADARAKAGFLQARDLDADADADALRRLALWTTRYAPAVCAWSEDNGADGFFLDVAGAAHLFGGEKKLMKDLARRLHRFGFPARLAIADTAGAAWALCHFHAESIVLLSSGQEAEALAPLPIDALRLSRDTRMALRRLGFKRIRSLIDAPRAPFGARFEKELLRRLDQALGRAPEPLVPVTAPPLYHARRALLEPIASQQAVVKVATRLMQDLAAPLTRDGVGARSLRLSLYRVDGDVAAIEIGVASPTRDARHVGKLIELKLERIGVALDASFGFEALSLSVLASESMAARQIALAPDASGANDETAALLDRLRQRLGERHVLRLAPAESHLPERAEATCNIDAPAQAWPAADASRWRPPLLLPQPEEVKVMALVPDEAPRRFLWRGKSHSVARRQGPERIADEWWRASRPRPARDYYLLEDEAGHRFWLYREGVPGREVAAPRWFMHGLFA